ncbi:MAG: EF-hand domain-containing protein [Devosia nanyangense]|uniref:EF-hand domain-containing protein n=1 Tax=Devosia nanyangense TaxID=1228055 RepID=A0A933L3I3_9HYPH|nr:EF-hand domain-containing protein [Devosia nanyangense]
MSISGVGGGASMMRSFQPPSFNSLDSDSSGAITLEELKSNAPDGASDSKSAARAEKLFKAMDADGSGSVSSDEKDAFDAKVRDQQQGMQFMTQLMAGGMQPPSNDDIFAATDKDGSGSVSLDEFSQGDAAEKLSTDQLSKLFSIVDSDSDGAISKTESAAFLDTLKTATEGQMGPPPSGGPGGPGGAGGPPPGGPPPGDAAEGGDDEASSAIDLLTAATTAYASTQKSTDLLSALSAIFDEAA